MHKLRYISTITIALSLMFFMAHLVLPHHHHHDHVCLDFVVDVPSDSCCDSCEPQSTDNSRSCGENHCRAYDPFLVRIDSDHDVTDCCGLDFTPALFCIIDDLNILFERPAPIIFRTVEPPYLICRYLEYAADSLALRAPPINSEFIYS